MHVDIFVSSGKTHFNCSGAKPSRQSRCLVDIIGARTQWNYYRLGQRPLKVTSRNMFEFNTNRTICARKKYTPFKGKVDASLEKSTCATPLSLCCDLYVCCCNFLYDTNRVLQFSFLLSARCTTCTLLCWRCSLVNFRFIDRQVLYRSGKTGREAKS